MSLVLSAFLLLLMVLLNLMIMVAVAYALCKRKKLTEADASVQKKVARIVARLSVVVAVNLGCSLPVLMDSFSIKIFNSSSLAYLLFVSLGVSNNLIYLVGDKGVRDRASKLTKCPQNCK